jgi:hypothetical protein
MVVLPALGTPAITTIFLECKATRFSILKGQIISNVSLLAFLQFILSQWNDAKEAHKLKPEVKSYDDLMYEIRSSMKNE